MQSRRVFFSFFLLIATIIITIRGHADSDGGWVMGIWDVDLATTSRVMKENFKAESDKPESGVLMAAERVELMDRLIDSLMLQLNGMSMEITPSNANFTGAGKNIQNSHRSIKYKDGMCIITGEKGDITTLYRADSGLWLYSDDKVKKIFFSRRKITPAGAAEAPNGKIGFDEIFNSKEVIKLTNSSTILNGILTRYSATKFTIYFGLKNAPDIPFQPQAGLVGGDSSSNNLGDYVKFSAATIGYIMIKGKYVYSFAIILRYSRDDQKGILYIPIWADIDSTRKDPKIVDWGILGEELSYVSQQIKS